MKNPSSRVSALANFLTIAKRIRQKYKKNLGGDRFSANFF